MAARCELCHNDLLRPHLSNVLTVQCAFKLQVALELLPRYLTNTLMLKLNNNHQLSTVGLELADCSLQA